MISVLTALALLHQSHNASYDFPLGTESRFNVKVQFDGFVPLFGGKNGKIDVDMVVKAVSVATKRADLQAIDSEIVELKGLAFGMALPVTKDNIGGFYPKAIATIFQSGLVKNNAAEHIDMPVKLPGLDSQRLPEISYVPLVIDKDAVDAGKPYEFSRTFNGAVMKYKVTPGEKKEQKEIFQIEVSQSSSGFEDSYGNPIVEAGAKSKLKTNLNGKGTAVFNFAKRMFDKVVVETIGDTDVTNIKTGKTSKRKLKTTLTIIRDGAKVDE